jgi:dipeptidyl-peptidase-4
MMRRITRLLFCAALAAAPALAPAPTARAEKLTIERIFSDPGLSGPTLRQVKISPDGSRVTFLKSRAEDYLRYDLWEYNIKDKATRMLVDSEALLPGEEVLSDEERARRERMRLNARGIAGYHWAEDGKALLFPLGGDLYYYDLAAPEGRAVKRLTDTETFETDERFSPRSKYVSFIRDQDIFVVEIGTGRERRITFDGEGTIKNGMAEFVAQEEMGRLTGYWWSDDDKKIAFLQVDESPVEVTQRYEIYADDFKVFDQRYPFAGTNNVTVKLAVADVGTGEIRWLDLGENADIYVARVNWLHDSAHLAVQRESRDQKTLDLIFYDVESGAQRAVLTETSDTWINLNDDLRFLKKKDQFIWASDRNGYKHLYLYSLDGNMIRRLTEGQWDVSAVRGVDEAKGLVYFEGFAKSPLEKHLYSTSLKTRSPGDVKQITKAEGWYTVAVSDDGKSFVAWYSSTDQPTQVGLYKTSGSLITFLEENALDETHPYYPYLDHHVTPEFGSLEASDGSRLYYKIIKPIPFDPRKKYPVVVYVYGGPASQIVTKSWGNQWFQYLAQNGYIVFSLDNRGTPNRGRAFEGQIYHHQGSVEVDDQAEGVEFLRSLPYVDGERVGMFGWSNGGYMTLMCMMKAPGSFHAGVAVAPVTDWRLYDTHYTERYLGLPGEDPEAYEQSSVFPYIDGLKGPLLLVHGMADDNVLFTNSTKLYKALQDNEVMFEMMDYPGSKHGIRGKKTRIHLYRTMTSFLDKNLKRGIE